MAKLYKVDDILERTTINRKGLIEKKYRITATSQSGMTFTVEIPESDFTQEKVDQVLSNKASLIEGIKKL
jgi:hypothetical protein